MNDKNLISLFSIKSQIKKLVDQNFPYRLWSKFAIARDTQRDFYADAKDMSFANIGSGKYFYHPRWDCYDIYQSNELGNNRYYLDLLKNDLPKKYDVIYSSHTIEHLPASHTKRVFRMLYDSLSNHGVMRIVVPDAELAFQRYLEGDKESFLLYKSIFNGLNPEWFLEYSLLWIVSSRHVELAKESGSDIPHELVKKIRHFAHEKSYDMDELLDYLIAGFDCPSPDGMSHINWFSYRKISELLTEAGFRHVYRSAFGQSKCIQMRDVPLFDGWLPSMSMYIEASKDF